MKVDIAVVGAGIIGAALADALSQLRLKVAVIEAGIPGGGTSAAGMGHLVALDGNAAELALARDGLRRWQALQGDLPSAVEYRACGTLWLARNEEEMATAAAKQAVFRRLGLKAELLTPEILYRLEPNLAQGLAGGLLRPDEAVIYPPAAVAFLLQRAELRGTQLIRQRAQAVDEGVVRLEDGSRIAAEQVVVAAGVNSTALVPGLPLQPRKGQLVITERYAGLVRHQLIELGYAQSAHGNDDASVAFNVQPRATGQLLIGSSRQYHDSRPEIDWPLLRRMLLRAFDFLPGLRHLQAVRTWTGLRPATPDKLPLLGPLPDRPGLWLATGHEGLGITTALSSAAHLAARLTGRPSALPSSAYDPARFSVATPEPEICHG
ncbi:NAD(P)/FAD-dependent oxidoreductase [Chitinimonas lacunae]|uniref:NAD(P)/FAD-dependent oxidoreductase n=1 Tax=Chitinimonas lacunae TaxID=1963018 RepID=A0ABV8MWA6_9NEIS